MKALMGDFVGLCAIVLVAVSPLLWRFYIERFWVHGRGTVIRLDGGISTNPDTGGGTWVWTPIIEYHAAGQRFSSTMSYMHRINAKSKYSVGDEVEILYNPREPSRVIMRNSWAPYVILPVITGSWMISTIVHGR
jgi:Protein of unknown function (DUF3592)